MPSLGCFAPGSHLHGRNIIVRVFTDYEDFRLVQVIAVIRYLHVVELLHFHSFVLNVANHVWLIHDLIRDSHAHSTSQLMHLLSLRHDHLSLRLLLLVLLLRLLELVEGPEKLDLPALPLLRNWL